MNQTKDQLDFWQAETIKCVKCGTCRSVCPIFEQLDHETVVARGKISLINAMLEGKQDFSPRMKEVLGLCLVCKRCTANCPGGVKIDEIVTRARTAFETKTLSIGKRAAFRLVRSHSFFNTLLRTGAKFQNLFFRRDKDKQGMYPRLPVGISRRRLLAPIASHSFIGQQPRRINGKMKVAFYAGCMINHIYHDIGEAVVKVLKAGQVDVIIPKRQVCCGTPLSTSGDRSSAAELAARNIEALTAVDVDAVVVACASCGLSLKKEFVELCSEYKPELVEKAKTLSEKVYDFSEFYLKYLTDLKLETPVNKKVTYHDPCHLVRGQGVSQEPREIVKSIPGVDFVEAKDADKCCGSGGSFSLIHYDLSTAINDEKIANLDQTGAEISITSCPACKMHINDGLARNNSGQQAKHVAELLAETLLK